MTVKINEYEKQANDFLNKTNTKILVEYLGTYNRNDFGVRDNYKITLTRGERAYSFEFSNSLNNSGKFHIIEFQDILAISHKRPSSFHNDPNIYIIRDKKVSTTVGHNRSISQLLLNDKVFIRENKDFREPNAYDVLTCLEKYGHDDFADFCANCGYDEDSIKANKLYEAVKEEYLNMQKLFNDDELEQLREIQ
jgi:hypothetical protein